jgi:hypothetical protein
MMSPDWKIEVAPDRDGIVRVTTVTAVGMPARAVEELSKVIYKALGAYVPGKENRVLAGIASRRPETKLNRGR